MKQTRLGQALAAAMMVGILVLGLGALVPLSGKLYDAKLAGQLATVIYALDANTTYIGTALPGSSRTAAVWQCKKITSSGTDYPNTTATTWANGANTWVHPLGANCESMLALNYE